MKVALGFLGVLALAALAGLAWAGLFHRVVVAEQESGPWVLVAREHRGAYREIAKVIEGVRGDLAGRAVAGGRAYGLYLDNPRTVPEAELRSEGGLLFDRLEPAQRRVLAKAGFKVSVWPRQNCLTANFPMKGSLSVLLGIFRVYPALGRALRQRGYAGGPSMEIYDAAEITYLMPAHK